jgi:hypothetical protein
MFTEKGDLSEFKKAVSSVHRFLTALQPSMSSDFILTLARRFY